VRAELEAAERERTLWTEERQRFEPSATLAATVLRAALARYAAGEASFVEIVDARRMAVDVAERAVAIDLALRRAELRQREAAGEWR
jgi:outer membrane protein TolC